MSNYSSNYNISNEHLLLVNILNNMYNDNLRQINQLIDSNNEIRNTITNLLYTRNNSRTRGRSNLFRNNYSTVDEYSLTIPILDFRLSDLERSGSTNTENLAGLFRTFFEPVEVFPTQSQIDIATRRVRYCDIISPRNRSCPISLENFNDNDMVTVIRHCGHIFNTEQLNTWFRSHCGCPVCRYDIRVYNETTSNSETSNTDNQNSSEYDHESSRSNNTTNNLERTLGAVSNLLNGNNSLLNTYRDISGNSLANTSDTQTLYNLLSTLRRSRH